ncbi:telomerase Cajal body protein 1 homolog [Rhagoletis pomonella]|uniref:telomerase Cajal body protein 1 homolog n=1 Tax=Rhagoletis pomonella TaxID=28610 RepID=UPI00177AB9D2|nr:telomerase Cajal body protein 1 homolog [Rhagoletis pomonella]
MDLSFIENTSTPRDSTYSFSLDKKVSFCSMEMSTTVADEQSATNNESTTKDDSCELSANCAAISLDESATIEAVEAEESLGQIEMLNGTEQTNDVEAPTEVQYQVEEEEFFQNALIELGRRLWKSSAEKQHYTKGCLWSPDGLCILLPVHLDGMHVIELPSDVYTDCAKQQVTATRTLSKLETAVHVKEGGTVYDYVWYPFMNSQSPVTCCWLATRQHEPIHMWDAFTGELRCTYRGYDSVDEVESAIAVTFSNDGEQVFGGYKKSIKVFDTNVPGRDSSSFPVKQAVSCFALTTNNDSTVTTGSWMGYINHYDLRAPKLGSLFTLGGHTGGITWLRYAALADSDSWSLFSGARKDNKILEWDMRNYLKPVREFTRNIGTNQRIYFDLSPQEQRWLVSGDTTGKLRIWDLQNNVEEAQPLHGDCCNGVNFHPSLPILATTSGQHHFVNSSHNEESPESKKSAMQDEDIIIDYENALMLWWIGP